MTSKTGALSLTSAAVAAAVLILAAPASAQTEPSQQPQQVESAAEAPTQVPTAPRPAAPPPGARPAYWTANAGFEADTHDTGYGFAGPFYVRPFSSNMAVVAGGSVNYLYYDYANVNGGHTNVRSPGVSAMGGVRFGTSNYLQLLAGPGFKRRHVEVLDANDRVIRTDRDIRVGLNLGADASINPTSHNNIFGMIRYGAEDQYTWGRLAYKEQITNRDWSRRFAHFVGAEVIGQGNDDIQSTQLGGFFEIAHAPTSVSVMFRAGYKWSDYELGASKTGPWFAIGLWHRLR